MELGIREGMCKLVMNQIKRLSQTFCSDSTICVASFWTSGGRLEEQLEEEEGLEGRCHFVNQGVGCDGCGVSQGMVILRAQLMNDIAQVSMGLITRA